MQAEIETHAQPGSLSVYVHYGQSRLKEAKLLAQNDIVLTTYGVLASEFSAEVTSNIIFCVSHVLHAVPFIVHSNTTHPPLKSDISYADVFWHPDIYKRLLWWFSEFGCHHELICSYPYLKHVKCLILRIETECNGATWL